MLLALAVALFLVCGVALGLLYGATEMPIEFSSLQCSKCDGELFTPLVYVKHRPGGGIVEQPCGWQCAGCGQRMDAAAALRAQDVKAKREELRQLEAELGVEHAPE